MNRPSSHAIRDAATTHKAAIALFRTASTLHEAYHV